MTDNDDSQKPEPPKAEPSQPQPTKGAPPPHGKAKKTGKKRSGARWWLAAVILIIFALPIGAGYGAWLVWEKIQEQSATLAQRGTRLEQLEQSLSGQSHTLEQQAQALNRLPDPDNLERSLRRSLQQERREQDQLLETLEQRVSRVDRRLSAIASTDREDWKLAEAEYLLRVANQRLVLERDTGNALALAQTADGILRDLDDRDLTPVRRALTGDIQALKLIERADREGIYLQLLALGEQVSALAHTEPLAAPGPGGDPELDDEPTSGAWARIKQSLHNVMQRLSNHIRIRQHDEPVSALADPREAFYRQQQLQLRIEQAQTALLRSEANLYRTSLGRATDWVTQHYPNNSQTREVVRTFNELADIEIAAELPDLDLTLDLLERHVDQLQRLSPGFQSPRGNGANDPNAENENEGGESAP